MNQVLVRTVVFVSCSVFALAPGGCDAEDPSPTREELEEVRLRALPERSAVAPSDVGAQREATQPGQRRSEPITPKETLVRYFDEITLRDFDRAWARLSPEVQAQFGGYETWTSGYGKSVATELVNARVTEESGNRVSLTVRINSEDAEAGGQRLTQVFEGPWTLEKRNGEWIVAAAQFSLIG